jgi:hypothetical protein
MILSSHGIIGSSITSDPYAAILSYATAQGYTLPSLAQQSLQAQLLDDLITAGIWDKLDTFAVFATDGDSDFALIDWKTLSQYTQVNSPTFTTNQGFSNDGTSSYVDTNYNPTIDGVNFTLNDASYGFYTYNWPGGTFTGTYPYDANRNYIRYSNRRVLINSGILSAFITIPTSNQFLCVNRINSNDINIISNGTNVESLTLLSISLSNATHRTAFNNTGKVSIVFSGGNLTSEASDFYTFVNSYMTAI